MLENHQGSDTTHFQIQDPYLPCPGTTVTWEAQRDHEFKLCLTYKVNFNLERPYLKIKGKNSVGDISSVIEYLHSTCKSLSSIPSIRKKKFYVYMISENLI